MRTSNVPGNFDGLGGSPAPHRHSKAQARSHSGASELEQISAGMPCCSQLGSPSFYYLLFFQLTYIYSMATTPRGLKKLGMQYGMPNQTPGVANTHSTVWCQNGVITLKLLPQRSGTHRGFYRYSRRGSEQSRPRHSTHNANASTRANGVSVCTQVCC